MPKKSKLSENVFKSANTVLIIMTYSNLDFRHSLQEHVRIEKQSIFVDSFGHLLPTILAIVDYLPYQIDLHSQRPLCSFSSFFRAIIQLVHHCSHLLHNRCSLFPLLSLSQFSFQISVHLHQHTHKHSYKVTDLYICNVEGE